MEFPQPLGDYQLLGRLGGGAMGDVFRARRGGALGFEVDVAIKLIDRFASEDHSLVRSRADEAHLLSRIRHPNIVRVHEFARLRDPHGGERHALVLEYVPGQNLKDLLGGHRGRPFPVAALVHLLTQAIDALIHAGGLRDESGQPLGLVHRDLKPANLMVTPQGDLRILDFGIAWASQRVTDQTETGVLKGTLRYMSPEQLGGEPIDPRSDVYSLGLIAFEALAGEPFIPRTRTQEAVGPLLGRVYTTRLSDRWHVLLSGLTRAGVDDPGEHEAITRLLLSMLARATDARPGPREVLELLEPCLRRWPQHVGRRQLRELTGTPEQPDADGLPGTHNEELVARDVELTPTRTTLVGRARRTRVLAPALGVGLGVLVLTVGALTLKPDEGGESAQLPPLEPAAAADSLTESTSAEPPREGPELTPVVEPEPPEVTPEPVDAAAGTPTPKRAPPPTPRSTPTPAPREPRERAPTPRAPAPLRLDHTRATSFQPGLPLVLSVTVSGDRDCDLFVVYTGADGQVWERSRFANRGGGVWKVALEVPYAAEYERGLRYRIACVKGRSTVTAVPPSGAWLVEAAGL